MARMLDREKALALRKQEMSYSQIKEILGISKSTLSGWLKNYPLSKERINMLRGKSEKRIERYRETRRKTREKRLNEFYLEQKHIIFPLDKREIFLAGLFLYWGEGSKNNEGKLIISNTDPSIINFFISWIIKCFDVPKDRIKVALQLYADMEIEKEKKFWSNVINIPLNQFSKPYIKTTLSSRINHKGGFGHGTCNVRIGNARLRERVLMGLKSISDEFLNLRS